MSYGYLRYQANLAAAERSRASSSSEPYRWVAGLVPDTTWTNNPEPPEWADMIERVNNSLGGQVNRYPIGYKPTFFVEG